MVRVLPLLAMLTWAFTPAAACVRCETVLVEQIVFLGVLGEVDRIISPDGVDGFPCFRVILPLHQHFGSILAASVVQNLLEHPHSFLIGLRFLALSSCSLILLTMASHMGEQQLLW